ncbi:MAG: AAA family ATPase [Cytophagales bacterium]|nr:AAA family ATPase [Cytophagales bacterium]
MTRVKQLLAKGEGVRAEFKESRSKLPASLFESICAMLNHDGGDIFLGVDDNGQVIGVDQDKIETITTNLVNLSNNSEKLDPPFILFPQIHSMNKKTVVHIQIPCSSQLHKSSGIVFDRSNDGDFRVNEPQRIAEIYNKKRAHYTEGIIYPEIQFSDFNPTLFPKFRNLIKSNEANHPWLALSDEQLLKKAGLWKRDFQSAKEGYTLAAVLLLGTDEVIQQVLPHYKIDALVRIENTDRYDDRLYIQTNLIDSYDQLMSFVAKHLPDKFYTEGTQRKSLRTAIFREIVANLLVHREYTNAHPTSFIIYGDKVETKNANNPHGAGNLLVDDFSPFPKNPLIAKFFIQLGRVDELGSGVINVNKFIKKYSGKINPTFIEGTTFKIKIPLTKELTGGAIDGVIDGAIDGVIGGATEELKEKLTVLLKAIISNEGKRVSEYKKETNIGSERTIERYFQQLRDVEFIEFKGDSAKTGGYFITEALKKSLANRTNEGIIDGVTDGAIDGVIDGTIGDVTEELKRKLTVLLKAIISNEGKRVSEYKEETQLGSERTIERYIQQLRNAEFIEFKGGSAKTGGYFLTEVLKEKLN